MYAYCLNNPANMADTTGTMPAGRNTVYIDDGGYSKVLLAADISDDCRLLTDYLLLTGMPQAEGTVFMNVERVENYVYDESSEILLNATRIGVDFTVAYVLKATAAAAVGKYLLAYDIGCFVFNAAFPEPNPLVPGEYCQFRVTQEWSEKEKSGNVVRRYDYTSVSYYIWQQVGANEGMWRVISVNKSWDIFDYVEW